MRKTEKRTDEDIIGSLSPVVSATSRKKSADNRQKAANSRKKTVNTRKRTEKQVTYKRERSQIFSFRGFVAYMVFSTLVITLVVAALLFISPKGEEWNKWTLLNMNEEQWNTVFMVFRALLLSFTELLLLCYAGTVARFVKNTIKEFSRPKLEYLLGFIVVITLFLGTVREWEFVDKIRELNDKVVNFENVQTADTESDDKPNPNISVKMSDELAETEKSIRNRTSENLNLNIVRPIAERPSVRTQRPSDIRSQRQYGSQRNPLNARTQRGYSGNKSTYGSPIRTRIR